MERNNSVYLLEYRIGWVATTDIVRAEQQMRHGRRVIEVITEPDNVNAGELHLPDYGER